MIKLLRSGQKPPHLLHQNLNRDFIQISQSPIAGGFPTMTLVLLQEKELSNTIWHKMQLHAQYSVNVYEICRTKRSWKDVHFEGIISCPLLYKT